MKNKEKIDTFDVLHNQIKVGELKPEEYFIELCVALKEMKKTGAYEKANYNSFPQYRRRETNISRARANDLISVFEGFNELLSALEGYYLLLYTGWSKARKLNRDKQKFQEPIEKGLLDNGDLVLFGKRESKRSLEKKLEDYNRHDLWSRVLIQVYCQDEYDDEEDENTPAMELYEKVGRRLFKDISENITLWGEDMPKKFFGLSSSPADAAAVCYEFLTIKKRINMLVHWEFKNYEGFMLPKFREFTRPSSSIEKPIFKLEGKRMLENLRYLSNPYFSLIRPYKVPDFELRNLMKKQKIQKLVDNGEIKSKKENLNTDHKNFVVTLKDARKVAIITDLTKEDEKFDKATDFAEKWVNIESRLFNNELDLTYFLTTFILEDELKDYEENW